MRVLAIPNLALANVRGDSSWNTLKDFCQAGVGRIFVYMVVPDDYADRIPEELPENVKVLVAPYKTPGFYEWEGFLDRWLYEKFAQTVGKYPIEVVYLTSSVGVAPLQKVLSNRERRYTIPVVINDLMAIDAHGFMRGTTGKERATHGLRALGYALGHAFVPTRVDAARLGRLCRRWLAASMCQQVEQHSIPWWNGIQCAEIRRIIEGVPKADRYTIVWSGRMNPRAGADKAMGVLKGIYEAGHDTPAVVSSSTEEGPAFTYLKERCEILTPPESWDIRFGAPRPEFLRRVARGHVFLEMRAGMGYGLAQLEQLYVGLVGVFPKTPHFIDLCGEDYPFLYKGKAEAYSMLQYLETHWSDEDVQARVRAIQARIEERFDNRVVRRNQMDAMQTICDAEYPPTAQSLFRKANDNRKLLEDALIVLRTPRLVAFSDVLKAIDVLERRYFNPHRAARLTPFDVFRGLKYFGYRDLVNAPDPVMEKVAETPEAEHE